MSNAYFLYA